MHMPHSSSTSTTFLRGSLPTQGIGESGSLSLADLVSEDHNSLAPSSVSRAFGSRLGFGLHLWQHRRENLELRWMPETSLAARQPLKR